MNADLVTDGGQCVGDMERLEEGEYLFTTIDFTHSDPRYRSIKHVSVHLQMDYDELVAGASIDVSGTDTAQDGDSR